jgi:hypothetical protein
MGTPSETDTTIEALLQRRAQFEQWLARLEAAGDKAPPAVRQRVRADYEGRLKGVIDELRGHAATISEELERHRGAQAKLDGECKQAEEALAEAEVRHAVGEYSEDEWRGISDRSQSNLGRLRQELSAVGDEISRLAEVQSLIASTPRRVDPAPSVDRPAPATVLQPELEIDHATPPPTPSPYPPAAASRSTPPPRREPAPVQAVPPGDELAFLKSVSEEEKKPATRRASNPGGGPGQAAARAADAPSPAAAAAVPAGKTATPSGAKTLKCGECGTLNRPTEWYCERCGGELAGL